jgi:acetyltransferase-like isoleucine patch superfamily enzyme
MRFASYISAAIRSLRFGRKRPRPELAALAERYPSYEIGRKSYGDVRIIAYDTSTRLLIGRYCSFADGVEILVGGEHRPDWVTTYPFNALDPRFSHIKGHPHSKGDIVIGNDVWIGRNAIILSGVKIGDGAVVAAGSVVVKNIPPFSIAAGNPAKVIKARFPDDVIAALLEIQWWNWDEERVDRAVPMLQSSDVSGFISAVHDGRL